MEQEKKIKEAFAEPPGYTTYNIEVATPQNCKNMSGGCSQAQAVWSSRLFGASLCSIFCCGFFGIIASAMSIMSYVDHRFNDLRGVASRQKLAKIFMILAFVIGTCFFIVCITAQAWRVYHGEEEEHHYPDMNAEGSGYDGPMGGHSGEGHHGMDRPGGEVPM